MNDLIIGNSGTRISLDAPFRKGDRNTLRSFRHMLGATWSKRRLACITALVIFALVMGGGFLVNRSYYAEAMLEIRPSQVNIGQINQQQAVSGTVPDSSAIDTEVEILRSPTIAEAVVRKLGLADDPEFGAPDKRGPIRRAIHVLVSSVAPQPRSQTEIVHRAAALVMGHSRIRRIGHTYMVQVGFVANSTEKAEAIANAITAAYIQQKFDQKLAAVKRASDDLGQTLAGLRRQAGDAQSRVDDYVAHNGLLAAESANLAQGELASLNEKLADAHVDAEEKLAAIVAAQQDQQSSAADNTLGALRDKESDTSATLAQLQTQFGPEYPAVKKAQAKLQDIQSEIQSESKRVLATLGAQARIAERKEAAILASRNQVEQQLQSNSQARAGLLPLQQTADSAKTIYETYLQRASEVTAQRGLQELDAAVESEAVPGADTIFSNISLLALISAILALVGSVSVVMFTEMWTPRIRSHADVRRETGMPVVAFLPDATLGARRKSPAAYVTENPLTAVAEAFRSLGAFLTMPPQRRADKVITVTSAVPGEGKTLTSVCLAKTLAAQGARVVLIDCDLRRPSVSAFFSKPQYDLSDVIQGGIPVERAMIQDAKSGVCVLAGTRGVEVPTFLFSDCRLAALLAQLAGQFDHVIIDTPPILGFTDARILAAKADQVLLLVKWNRTPASVVGAAMEVLRLCNARVTGVVLNKVDVRQQAVYGFADGSDYHRHYGSAYEAVRQLRGRPEISH